MNLMGYFDAEEVWIPDPIAKGSQPDRFLAAVKYISVRETQQVSSDEPCVAAHGERLSSIDEGRASTSNIRLREKVNMMK